MTAILLLIAIMLTVFWMAIVGWLLYRTIRARLGVAGNILLLAIQLVLSFCAIYVLVALSLATPLRILWWLVLVGSAILLAYITVRAFPFPTPPWLAAALGATRRLPAKLAGTAIGRMGLRPGMTVVEIGAGTGRLSFDVAKLLLPGGRLLCTDARPEAIQAIRTKVAGSGIENIETYVALVEQLPAGIADADLVLFVAVIGEVNDKQAALAEAFRVLKPGGVLSISEFHSGAYYCNKHEVKHWATQAGFEEGTTEGDTLGYTSNFRKPQSAPR